jgi:hypothetical protein
MRDRQVAARSDRLAQRRHDGGGIVGVRQEVQDREQPDRDRPVEVEVRPDLRHREQVAGMPEVGLHHDATVLDREQGLPVGYDYRVVVGVDDSRIGVDLVRHLVHGTLCGQPDADIEELDDASFRYQIPHDPPQEPPVLHRRAPQPGHQRENPLRGLPVRGEVVLAPEVVVVHSRHVWHCYVQSRHSSHGKRVTPLYACLCAHPPGKRATPPDGTGVRGRRNPCCRGRRRRRQGASPPRRSCRWTSSVSS